MLNAILWIMLLATAVTVATTSILGPFRLSAVIFCTIYVAALLVARHWMILGRVRVASLATVAATWLAVSFSLMNDGVQSPAVASYIQMQFMMPVSR